MQQKNNIELESAFISRLNHERELFVQQVTDWSRLGTVERDHHANLMQSVISSVDRILNHAGSHADDMASLREIRTNAINLLSQLDQQQNAFDDIFEADVDPI